MDRKNTICERCNGNHLSAVCPFYTSPNKRESPTYCTKCKRTQCRCFPYKTFISDKLDALSNQNKCILTHWSTQYKTKQIGNGDIHELILQFVSATERDAYLSFKPYAKLCLNTNNDTTMELKSDGWCCWTTIVWEERSSDHEFYKTESQTINDSEWSVDKDGIVIIGHFQRHNRLVQCIEDVPHYTIRFGFYELDRYKRTFTPTHRNMERNTSSLKALQNLLMCEDNCARID
eukprot:1039406_1